MFGAAQIAIINNNAAGVGFNDPTPAAPIGGNPGTTVGEQRLNAFRHAAEIWGLSVPENLATAEWKVDAARFRTKGRNTPYEGRTLTGRVHMTLVDGRIVHRGGT